MRRADRTVFLFSVIFNGALSFAQPEAVLYPTYAAFERDSGEVVGTYVDLLPASGKNMLVFKTATGRRKVQCDEVWGFRYKDVLFRIESERHLPVRLMTKGGVCYYENGPAHLRMLRDAKEVDFYELGDPSYLSRNLQEEIVRAVFAEGDQTSSGRFREAHPQLEPLFTCLGDRDELDHTRQCVVDFEAALEGE